MTSSRRTHPSALERGARASAARVLRSGTIGTLGLMVLPGALSPDPVTNSLTGAAIGGVATLVATTAAYGWRSYVEPYRRVRRLVRANDATPRPAGRDEPAWASA